MPYRAQIDDHGVVTKYKDGDTGEVISAKEYERRIMMQQGAMSYPMQPQMPQMHAMPPGTPMPMGNGSPQMSSPYSTGPAPAYPGMQQPQQMVPSPPPMAAYNNMQQPSGQPGMPGAMPMAPGQAPGPAPAMPGSSLVQPGAQMLDGQSGSPAAPSLPPGAGSPPTAGQPVQGKSLRMEGSPSHVNTSSHSYRTHGFLDATSIAILLPTLVLLALIIAAAHKKRLFPWQTIRTFNPPSGLMMPRDYERSHVCPPNLRRHGRLGKRNPQATWTEADGIVLPFGFLARTHLPITIPLGRLPNKNMFIVAPSGSGKTTLMRAVIKALMAKPCVIIALEAKANDPNLDEKKESFRWSLLPEAQHAGFDTLNFNPLDPDSVHWNPLDLGPIEFASSIVQDVNSLPPEEQHWAERDHGYIYGLTQLLKWGAVQVEGEDENGNPADVKPLPCNPRGLMRLVNNRRNIVESLRRLKTNPDVVASELNELTQTLSSIIRTDSDWDKNIQGVRGRLRMFKNANVLRCTESSNVDIKGAMHKPTVLIFGAPASMGPDAESLASCFVYQLQQALHTRYGTASVLPLFAFFDEYQTLNMDIAGRLSAIVRGANGGLTIILQNISQIARDGSTGGSPTASGASELKTIFSNSAVRVCLHNADESTAKFFSDEIGKHAIIVPGVSDHYDSNGFGIFPTSWNRIHSQQVVARVDTDSIKRMERHHALVFLSPAGDPEFGELKPFMCDLRGIEEIARLHLLHNIAGRSPQPGGVIGPDGNPLMGPAGPALPPGVAPGTGGAPPSIGSPVLARMMTPAGLEKAANMLSGGMGGVPVGGVAAAAAAGVAGATAAAVNPPFPGAAVPTGPVTGQPAGVAPAGNGPASNGVPSSDRFCTKCGKYPGKGRFCIECGNFTGQAAAPQATATVSAQIMQQGPQTGGVPSQPVYQPQPTGAMNYAQQPGQPQPMAQPQARQPVTSLNVDMSKYGVPGQKPLPVDQPGQQPIPRPQQRGSGIEF